MLAFFKRNKEIIIIFLFIFSISKTEAQLGFCTGNSGDPIFTEDFGSGYEDVRIPSGSTTYKFTKGMPKDGGYKVSNNTKRKQWFAIKDHTSADGKGRALIVNASNVPGEFFKIPVSNLCENTTYEFSSWLINLMPAYYKLGNSGKKGKPINVTFEIWDSTGRSMIKSGNTGNIHGSNSPNWKQYGLVFQTKPGQTSVILKMRNNGSGGFGNDLAIDDIMFRTCGDKVLIVDELKKSSASIYLNELPYSTILTAKPDFSVFSTHFYQWQKSNNRLDWVNIKGEKSSSISVKNIKSTSYYRALVAEDAINLLNASCNSSSQIYKVNILTTSSPKKVVKFKPRKKIKKLASITSKDLTELMPTKKVNEVGFNGLKELSGLKQNILKTFKGGVKTKKQIIIVRDGLKVIYDKVWIDGGIGKFVQTGEKIIKEGEVFAGTIIEEIIYYKSIYGFNSVKRTYIVR